MNNQLQLGLRKNKGKTMIQRFTTNLMRDFHLNSADIVLYSLEETDVFYRTYETLVTRANDGYTPSLNLKVPVRDDRLLFDFLTAMRQRTENQEIVLFRSGSEYCGAVSMELHGVLDRVACVRDLHDDPIHVCTPHGEAGLYIDYYNADEVRAREAQYEMSVRGASWLS